MSREQTSKPAHALVQQVLSGCIKHLYFIISYRTMKSCIVNFEPSGSGLGIGYNRHMKHFLCEIYDF